MWGGWERRTAGVSTGEGLEAVHEFAASAAVGVSADARCDHNPVWAAHNALQDRSDEKVVDSLEVGVAAGQQVWARLSEHELHALCDHECGREREREAHPANVPLPELPPPNQRLGSSPASSRSGNEDHAHDEDDAGRRDKCDEDQEPCRDGFVVLEGIRDVKIDGRKGSIIWVDVFPASADCCDSAVSC
jgi:hypothetical protein